MGARDNLTNDEYRALAEFRFQLRRFLHFSEQAARAAGLEPQQHQLLLTLRGFPTGPPVTIGDLAERLLLQHHSTVELVDRSSRQGLVERQRDEADRRRVFVRLTAAGEAVLRDLSLPHREQLRTAGPTLARALNALLINAACAAGEPAAPALSDHATLRLADESTGGAAGN
jgi:DNA-binding MarR family transcriptional regulator